MLVSPNLPPTTPISQMAFPQPLVQNVEKKLKEMDSIPLFMQSLPSDEDQPVAALEALQSLIYDGTPDGMAFCLY